MSNDLYRQVEQFLYREAELLDDRRLREWLELFTDDARYWMPVRHSLMEKPMEISDELSRPGDAYYFDDDKASLSLRVQRLYSKSAWSELPPSRTRRLITNVRVKGDNGADLEVHSNFLVYRTRLETDKDTFVGSRQDILRRVADSFKIAQRTIVLDQAVLDAKNISIFL
jgi:3-phenylpropionate/cinnamic acid dioxygenase small subunit